VTSIPRDESVRARQRAAHLVIGDMMDADLPVVHWTLDQILGALRMQVAEPVGSPVIGDYRARKPQEQIEVLIAYARWLGAEIDVESFNGDEDFVRWYVRAVRRGVEIEVYIPGLPAEFATAPRIAPEPVDTAVRRTPSGQHKAEVAR
jgi:hypothetical protein